MTTRDQRRRILGRLRRSCDDPPPRHLSRVQRMRLVEVMRLEAGLPARPPGRAWSVVPAFRRAWAEEIDLDQFADDRAWWAARMRRKALTMKAARLRIDAPGRWCCADCGEVLVESLKGLVALSPWAVAFGHADHCKDWVPKGSR